jgi:hypothetical protein
MSAYRDANLLPRPAWEYKIVSVFVGKLAAAEPLLNDSGSEGWELVGMVPGDCSTVVFTFKRLQQ